MLTLISLAGICVAAVVVIAIVLAVLSVPFMIIMGILPWLLGIAGIVLLIKGAMDQPFRWENFVPAAVAFILSGVLRWLF